MKHALLFFTLLAITLHSNAQITDDYKTTLKAYLEVSGSNEAFIGVIDQMIDAFKKQKPEVSAPFWMEIKADFIDSIDELYEDLAPIYHKYLTQEDLEGIIKFYKSPVGKKLALKTPNISKDSMAVGQAWGMKIGQRMQKKLQEGGY